MSGLLTRNILVISQKPKFIELTNEYEIIGEDGTPVGTIRQEGQSKARKLLRLVSSVDQFLTHKLAVYDADGTKVLELVRPAKVFKSTVEVHDAAGARIGKIVQENIVGKKRFRLDGPSEEVLGSIDAENWRSWDFAIHDVAGNEVGRSRRSGPGSSARASRRPTATSSISRRCLGTAPHAHGGLGRRRGHRAEAGRHRRLRLRRGRPRYLTTRGSLGVESTDPGARAISGFGCSTWLSGAYTTQGQSAATAKRNIA